MRVHLRNHEHFRLQVLYHLVGLLEVQRCFNGTVDDLHAKRVVRRERLQKWKVRLGEDDRVVGIRAVELDEMYDVAEPQARMSTEDYARLEFN